MKTATMNLENDHVQILRLIDVMEKMVLCSNTDVAHLEMIVNLIKNYADRFHHAKEEKIFFPQMANKGFSLEQGPIAVMLHEHSEGRNYVKGMDREIENYKNGNTAALVKINEHIQGYIVLLRNHISKENNLLFRMADNAFSEKEHQDLLEKFAEIESNDFPQGVLNDYIAAIDKLESEYQD
jgi:hemerythrin-like domain-containing protein